MKITIDSKIFQHAPALRLGCVLLEGIVNDGPESNALLKKLRNIVQETQHSFSLDTLTEVPFVSRWRSVYRSFGAKPSDYRSSIENLVRMVLNGRELSHISTLVDLYNFLSLKYKLPVGGEDVDEIIGEMRLTVAEGTEPPVKLLGSQHPEPPFMGEIVYRDDEGIICRCFNWREAARTSLQKSTKNAIIVMEAIDPEEYATLDVALDGLMTLSGHFLGGTMKRVVLTKDSPSVDFSFVATVSPEQAEMVKYG